MTQENYLLADAEDDDSASVDEGRRESDPGAYSATIDTPGTSKSESQKQKEDHVW